MFAPTAAMPSSREAFTRLRGSMPRLKIKPSGVRAKPGSAPKTRPKLLNGHARYAGSTGFIRKPSLKSRTPMVGVTNARRRMQSNARRRMRSKKGA